MLRQANVAADSKIKKVIERDWMGSAFVWVTEEGTFPSHPLPQRQLGRLGVQGHGEQTDVGRDGKS